MSLALILAAATAFADLDAIDRQVAEFTGTPAGARGGATLPLDRRLRLRVCRSPLALSWRGADHATVVAECPDAGGWRLFVPVSAAAGEMGSAPAVNRGDAVTIAISGDGFSINQPGEALDSAPAGGWVRVRPAGGGKGSGEPMRARVIRAGLVGIPLP